MLNFSEKIEILMRSVPPSFLLSLYCCCGWRAMILIVILGAAETGLALDSNRSIEQYAHRIWHPENGLTANSVRAATQTADGYLWLATSDGIVRFDGTRFVTINADNYQGLNCDDAYSIAATRDGSIWVGTNTRGVIRLKNGAATYFSIADGLAGNWILKIYEARDGSLWFGTRSGFSHFKDEAFLPIKLEDQVFDQVFSFAETGDGSLWIGTYQLLVRYQNDSCAHFGAAEGLKIHRLQTLAVDRDDRLWIGGLNGLQTWRDGNFTADAEEQTKIGEPIVMSLLIDRENNLWIGTQGGGIMRVTEGVVTSFDSAAGLSSDNTVSQFEDRDGSIWICTEGGGGLDEFYDGAITPLTAREGLVDNNTWTVIEAADGAMWIGTNNGLSKFYHNKFTNFTMKDGLGDRYNWALGERRDRSIWIGSQIRGVSRMANGRFQNFGAADGIPASIIRAIYEDRAGDLWIGTAEHGLVYWHADNKRILTVKDGLASNNVRCFLEDSKGNFWIGTQNGLHLYKNGKFVVFNSANGLPVNEIDALHEDAGGALWIATAGGLAKLVAGDRFAAVTSADGLYQNLIHSLLSDDEGNLWMSSNAGIFSVRKEQLEQFWRGEINQIENTVYNMSDGMKSRDCSGGLQPAGWRSRDGRLWFASAKGVAIIDPQNLRQNSAPPNVLIEDVWRDEKSSRLAENLTVSSKVSRLDFRFTAPNFRAPERLKFKYQLVGYDQTWHEAETGKRQVSYTNLPPGHYTFRVAAKNAGEVWDEARTADLAFYVEPHFYQTFWFYLLCAALVAGAGILFYRWRLARIRERFDLVLAERARIAREIHDTLAQGFVGTTVQLEAAEAAFEIAPLQAKEHLAQAKGLAKASLTEARRSIWDLRHEKRPSFDLPHELEKFIAQAVAKTAIAAETKVTGAPRPLSEPIRHNLFRIGQEAVVNAVKYSAAQKITSELQFLPGEICLRITDDGRGFDAEALESDGFGLTGMKERAKIIGADWRLKSLIGAGTKIEVILKTNDQ